MKNERRTMRYVFLGKYFSFDIKDLKSYIRKTETTCIALLCSC